MSAAPIPRPKTTRLHIEPLACFAKGAFWFGAHADAGEDLERFPPKILALWSILGTIGRWQHYDAALAASFDSIEAVVREWMLTGKEPK